MILEVNHSKKHGPTGMVYDQRTSARVKEKLNKMLGRLAISAIIYGLKMFVFMFMMMFASYSSRIFHYSIIPVTQMTLLWSFCSASL